MIESLEATNPFPDVEIGPLQRFHAAANSGANIFLTGMAGTGKSHLIREWISIRKNLMGKPDVDLTASTGIAALNIGGMTIHKWLGTGFGCPAGVDYKTHAENQLFGIRRIAIDRILSSKCIIIDEVSMLNAHFFGWMDYVCRAVRQTKSGAMWNILKYDQLCQVTEPFGGIQVICVGDFLQLPPVAKDGQKYDWVFKSPTWDMAGMSVICLTEQKRQEDVEFSKALAGARIGMLRGDSARLLQSRVRNNPPSQVPRLMTHNLAVDKWNDVMLSELHEREVIFVAQRIGHYETSQSILNSMLSPESLSLKIGCKVMFTANDTAEDAFYNGQLGTVDGFEHPIHNENMTPLASSITQESGSLAPRILVRTKEGNIIKVKPKRFSWSARNHSDSSDLEKMESATSVIQYPLKLAYAMTIHKAQGLTLPCAYVDINAAREPGQAYVGLSRIKTLGGLLLKDWPKGVVVSSEARKFYEEHAPQSLPL